MFGFVRMLIAERDKLAIGRMKVGSGRWSVVNQRALGEARVAVLAVTAAAVVAVAEVAAVTVVAAAPLAAPAPPAIAVENPGIK
jgi:hypothetical protein